MSDQGMLPAITPEEAADAALGRTIRALLLGDDPSKDAPIEVAYADATWIADWFAGDHASNDHADRLFDFISSIRDALHEGEDPAAEQIAAEDHI